VHRFEVFAPFAGTLEVLIGGDRYVMEPDNSKDSTRPGWWALEVGPAGAGTDYLFSIDGGPGRPDPRSGWQPAGIDGPSRVLEHNSYPWQDHDWNGLELEGLVLYELHLGTFSAAGTFKGAIEHLGHLVDLGVNAVELLPVAEASGERGWGYDGVDWFAPHHAYGGPQGMKDFVDACHQLGLGVVVDVVYNHLGPAGNYLAQFGPYFTDRYRTNWGDALNFDGPYSDEVRRLVIDNALMWLRDYHCDGLRLDAVHAISDRSARHVLSQLADEVREEQGRLGRRLLLIAESDLNDPRFVRPQEEGGFGLDGAWADEFHHALHSVLTGETSGYYEDFGSISRLATALEQAWVYAGEWSPHRLRTHGLSPAGLDPGCFVVFLQNHDQVGNRARGERIGELAGAKRSAIGAALYLLSGFVPLIFQGEEWMASAPFQYFTDHKDPELARAVSEGRRAEFSSFGWRPEEVPDPQALSSFVVSKLDWEEKDRPPHSVMLEWYRSLISFRRELPARHLGSAAVEFCEEEGWLIFRRPGVVVAARLKEGSRSFDLPGLDLRLLSGEGSYENGRLRLTNDAVAVLAPARSGAGKLGASRAQRVRDRAQVGRGRVPPRLGGARGRRPGTSVAGRVPR
jgi:maltooligosyltrehalose trehalohydrolase